MTDESSLFWTVGNEVFRSTLTSPPQVTPLGTTLAFNVVRQRGDRLYLGTYQGAVYSMPKTGGPATTHPIVLEDWDTFAVDDTTIYYEKKEGPGPEILAHRLDGSASWPLPLDPDDPVSGAFEELSSPLLLGEHVYFSAVGYSGQGPIVYRARKDGLGNVAVLLAGPDVRAEHLILAGDRLVGGNTSYTIGQTACDSPSPPQARVWASAPPYNAVTTVFASTGIVGALANGGDEFVYWADVCTRSIWRASVLDGAPLRLVKFEGSVSFQLPLAVAGPHLYYRDNSVIRRVAR